MDYSMEMGTNLLETLCLNYSPKNLIDSVKFLIEKGLEVDAKNGHLIVLFCWKYGHENLIDLVRLLVESGIDVPVNTLDVKTAERQFSPRGYTLLHILCEYYQHDNLFYLFRFLIEKGVDVNAEINFQVIKIVE